MVISKNRKRFETEKLMETIFFKLTANFEQVHSNKDPIVLCTTFKSQCYLRRNNEFE